MLGMELNLELPLAEFPALLVLREVQLVGNYRPTPLKNIAVAELGSKV
jgi:hypothetical protein